MTNQDELRLLVKQAFIQLRRYENAVRLADDDAAAMPAMRDEMEKWHRLERRVHSLKGEILDFSPELNAEIKKLYAAIESSNERTLLVAKGQAREAETLPKKAEEVHAQTLRALQISEDAKRHIVEFEEKWLSERNLTKATLTEAERAGLAEARDADVERWYIETNPDLSDEST